MVCFAKLVIVGVSCGGCGEDMVDGAQQGV